MMRIQNHLGMEIKKLFPAAVALGNIPDFDEVLNEIKGKTEVINGLLESDVFNDKVFSTNKKVLNLINELNLVKTKSVVEKLFEEYKQHEKGFSHLNMTMTQSWFNITTTNGFQSIHAHHFEELCGCFYLNVPKDSGNIEFAPLVEFASKHGRECIVPSTGIYIFFPGYLLHRVTYNKSSAQRISLCFNFRES